MHTNSRLNESESSGLIGAAMGMYEALAIWIGWLQRSMIVTIVALLLAGGSFIYAGTAIKDTEEMVVANRRGIDPEEVPRNTVVSSLKDIVQTFTDGQTSPNSSSFLTRKTRVGGLGVFLGIVFAFVTNATLAGSLFWIILFVAGTWTLLTPSGKKKRREIQRQLKLTLDGLQTGQRPNPENEDSGFNCPNCGAKNEPSQTTCRSCEVTLTTVDD